MKQLKEKATGLQPHGLKLISCSKNNNIFIQPGSYLWRKREGLLVISDHIFTYQAKRVPRGNYQIPLQEDLI